MKSKLLFASIVAATLLLTSTDVAIAQIYGVARRTTAVPGTAGVLPHGYIAVLPAGYRQVNLRAVRYYVVGGVYYRPQMYGGRTTYIRVHI